LRREEPRAGDAIVDVDDAPIQPPPQKHSPK
jgi:hypothetical protein